MSRILDALSTHARVRPNATAISGGGRYWTYAALQADVAAMGRELGGLLVDTSPDAPIALAFDNAPEWSILDLALMALGRPVLPLPPFFSSAQIKHALAEAGACAVIRPAYDGESALFAQQGAPFLTLAHTGLPSKALPDGTAKITFTSGSTAAPKGVCLSLTQLEDVAQSIVTVLGAENAGRHFAVLPMGVLLENVAGLYTAILSGGEHRQEPLATIGFASAFAPDWIALAGAIDGARANSLILVPELLRGLLQVWAARGGAPQSLRFVAVGGAKVSQDLLDLAARLGAPVFEGYGLSECGSVVALNTPTAYARGTAGRPLPHVQLSVAADGELIVGSSPFLGYVGDTREGPVRTGDLGALDADGFLTLSGRKSNLIINAHGRNISPEWVESELCGQPEIAQAIVAGEAQTSLCALIVPASAAIDATAIERAVHRINERLPEYARIDRFHLASPFTSERGLLTGNGRPRRGAILAAYHDFVEPTV